MTFTKKSTAVVELLQVKTAKEVKNSSILQFYK